MRLQATIRDYFFILGSDKTWVCNIMNDQEEEAIASFIKFPVQSWEATLKSTHVHKEERLTNLEETFQLEPKIHMREFRKLFHNIYAMLT